MMDNAYNPPKDAGYALEVLSAAAMQAPDPSAFDHSAPIPSNPLPTGTGLRKAPSITNHLHHQQQQQHHEAPNSMHERPSSNVTSSVPSSLPGHGYNSGVSAQGSMMSLPYNIPASRSNLYMQHGYQAMDASNYSSHLGILNAEQYDDGRSVQRAQEASEMRVKQQTEVPMPFGLTNGPQLTASSEENETGPGRRKKRARAEITGAATGAEEDDWASKKARGRPRVDTKDETAADRRRTQIRMAQRAYRHRKETTISSLEKQVQDLRGTSEEMSNTFIALYDFAIDKGLLQREPEFGQQLQSTIERIIALAKASSSEDGVKDEDQLIEETPKPEPIEPEAQPKRRSRTRRSSKAVMNESPPPPAEVPQQTWGGYEVSKEENPENTSALVRQDDNEQRDYNAAAEFVYNQQIYEHRTRSDDYQIISRATEDNASFPFDFNPDLTHYRVEVPPPENYTANFFSQTSLSLPTTYSFQEFSFARRLHRSALENACQLVNAPEPNEDFYRSVFGFCLLYENREAIKARIERCVSKSAKETLQDWRQPFVHVGGSGTHYPIYETNNHLMPKFRTGFSMGPQSPAVISAREEMIEDDLSCKLSGFEGEFFDSNDVEGYLRGRGVEISPAADFVTAEINLVALLDAPSPNSSSSDATNPSPKTPVTPANRIEELLDHAVYTNARELGIPDSSMSVGKDLPTDTSPLPLNLSEWNESSDNINIDPMLEAVGTNSGKKGKVTVTLNVNTLITEITNHAVCLGRGPGFRSADINAAILAAVKAGVGLV